MLCNWAVGDDKQEVRGRDTAPVEAGRADTVAKGAAAKRLELGRQLELRRTGDLTRQLDLPNRLRARGGWGSNHWSGWIGASFGTGCSTIAYCGPGYFPSHCLYPNWSDWVKFCWWYEPDPQRDPRPRVCLPVRYEPSEGWSGWSFPEWQPLPGAVSGTWLEVEPRRVEPGMDLQLLAVRFVDPGHGDQRLGPRYRVWIRNNGARAVTRPFNVLLVAGDTRELSPRWPQSGVRVTSIEPGEIQAVDVRLPWSASRLRRDVAGNPAPFTQLHVLVDSHGEIAEVVEANNGAVVARADVLPVDPSIFGLDVSLPASGSSVQIAGEGFGPGPGQVLVHVGGVELQAEVLGWCDLGVRVRLPALALASPVDAELIVVRGDTAASNPMKIRLAVPVTH